MKTIETSTTAVTSTTSLIETVKEQPKLKQQGSEENCYKAFEKIRSGGFGDV